MNRCKYTLPKIKSLNFNSENIELFLVDGRIISTPLNKFPEIKILSAIQRKKYHIMGGLGFDFDDSDEVYHISEFLSESNTLQKPEGKLKLYSKYNKTLPSLVAEDAKLYRKVKKPLKNNP